MQFGSKKPIVLVFFADAVPTEDEIDLAASMPGNVHAMTRNAAAVQPGEKPEKGDFVIATDNDIIPSPSYDNYPRFTADAARKITSEQKRDRKEARDKLAAGLAADGGVQPQLPQFGAPRAQVGPEGGGAPDLDAIHGRGPKPAETGDKLGGHPGTAPDGVTSRDGDAGGNGGDPGTPAPDPNAPAAKPGPKPAGWAK